MPRLAAIGDGWVPVLSAGYTRRALPLIRDPRNPFIHKAMITMMDGKGQALGDLYEICKSYSGEAAIRVSVEIPREDGSKTAAGIVWEPSQGDASLRQLAKSMVRYTTAEKSGCVPHG